MGELWLTVIVAAALAAVVTIFLAFAPKRDVPAEVASTPEPNVVAVGQTVHLEAAHVMTLPMVNHIQETLSAFFRTSDFGIWQSDLTKDNDKFRLHFVRGNWKGDIQARSRQPGEPEPKTRQGNLISKAFRFQTIPMLIACTIRPSPRQLRIKLECSCFVMGPLTATALNSVEADIDHEFDALRAYLAECFDLDSPPDLDEK